MTGHQSGDQDHDRGVLGDAAPVDTMGIGILDGTAQVSVTVPGETEDDDDLIDDSTIVADEVDLEFTFEGEADDEGTPTVVEPDSAVGVETAELVLDGTEAQDAHDVSGPADAAGRHASTALPAIGAPSPLELTSKRLGDLSEASRESADLLTEERLVDPARRAKAEPEGTWSGLVHRLSRGRINLGDSRSVRQRKALTARIAAPLTGGAKFVPILSRKGGVGKTTVTTLLGMALADAREDRVIAIDANPDRGTLADRFPRSNGASVRDLVRIREDVRGFHDVSAVVTRDATRLDVLASDADPLIAEAFSDADYHEVAEVAAHYYSLVLTDTGTGIVHAVMQATLALADQLVIVSALSVDEARLASETLTWLESNGHAEIARDAIVVLNQSTPGKPAVRMDELQTHFESRVRQVVRVPYDAQIAAGGAITFAQLRPDTRLAARELAAGVVESLRIRGN